MKIKCSFIFIFSKFHTGRLELPEFIVPLWKNNDRSHALHSHFYSFKNMWSILQKTDLKLWQSTNHAV